MLKGNKLLTTLLLLIMSLALCATAFGKIGNDNESIPTVPRTAHEGDISPTSPQELGPVIAREQAAAPVWGDFADMLRVHPDSMNATFYGGSHPAYTSTKDELLGAYFNDGLMPPTGWTTQAYGSSWRTWDIADPYWAYEGLSAGDGYDWQDQDNWLISPSFDLTTGGLNWQLDFAWLTGYYFMVSPNNNGDVYVKISTDGGTSWDIIWHEDDQPQFPDWADPYNWQLSTVDLSAYLTETDVRIAFQYIGTDADGFFLDMVSINDGTPNEFRCCYGDPMAPSCVDATQADCEALPDFLSWTIGDDCSNPCPIIAVGDNCSNPIVVTLPDDFVGGTWTDNNTTCGRGADYNETCLGYYGGGEDIIYAITPTSDVYIDIVFDPLGTYNTGFIITEECAPSYCDWWAYNWNADAYGSPRIVLTAGITYYLQIDVDEWTGCIPSFDLTLRDHGTPPPIPPNDDCADAIELTLPVVDLPGTCAGATPEGCIAPYGFDPQIVWYKFDLPYDCNWLNVDIVCTDTINNTSLALMDDCLCDDYIGSSAYEFPWMELHNTFWNLEAGTYYLPVWLIDNYTNLLDFTLSIEYEECNPPANDSCHNAELIPDFPAIVSGTCVGTTQDCPGPLYSWDGVWYTFEIPDGIYHMTVNYEVNEEFLWFTSAIMMDDCACDDYIEGSWFINSSTGENKAVFNYLEDGTYYYPVYCEDGWFNPTDFTFEISVEEAVINTGDHCSDPIKVTMYEGAEFEDLNQTTNGRGNTIRYSCVQSDYGDDIFYEIEVQDPGYYEFKLYPKGTYWTGFGLTYGCPPIECIAQDASSNAVMKEFTVYLNPGMYYVVLAETSGAGWPDFDFSVKHRDPAFFTYDQTMVEFCDVDPDQNGCFTMNIGNGGDLPLDYSISVEYGVPPTKDLSGSSITTTGHYTSGYLADVTFNLYNGSPDWEQIIMAEMTFPAGVTVIGATDIYNYSWEYLTYDGTTGDGVTVTWNAPSEWSGIGAWSSVDFTVSIMVDPSITGDLDIDYHLVGNGWPVGNHLYDVVTVSEGPPPADPYTSWLMPMLTSGTMGSQETLELNVCYNTANMTEEALYFGSIVITHNAAPISPVTIPVILDMTEGHADANIITVDRSGSMALTDAYGESRLDRAKELAHQDIISLQAQSDGGDNQTVAIMSFNADGIVLVQEFTDDFDACHEAVDGIVNPRHDTPLAAAMCQAYCSLTKLGCGDATVYTYTDGEENFSQEYDMCFVGDACYHYHPTGWNHDCDPSNPESCTEWQLCLADVFADNGVNIVNYFGSPINPYTKGAGAPEDMFFLKYTAENSDGEFNYYADAAFIPGDANGDSDINVSDAVYIINYVFAGGEAPQPYEAADANCDETVNVSDAVHLINYVFVGGPAPADCR